MTNAHMSDNLKYLGHMCSYTNRLSYEKTNSERDPTGGLRKLVQRECISKFVGCNKKEVETKDVTFFEEEITKRKQRQIILNSREIIVRQYLTI